VSRVGILKTSYKKNPKNRKKSVKFSDIYISKNKHIKLSQNTPPTIETYILLKTSKMRVKIFSK
jgi:hypothetical protein